MYKWVGLGANRTSFVRIGQEPELTPGLKFVDLCSNRHSMPYSLKGDIALKSYNYALTHEQTYLVSDS